MMSMAIGLDVGTLFVQTAKVDIVDELVNVENIRNAFVELPDEEGLDDILKRNEWQWVKDKNKYYVIGEDALRVANIFPKVELRRPMQAGVLNKKEEKKMLVMSEIIKSAIGKGPKDGANVVCTCVSSPLVGENPDITSFHQARLSGMISRLNYEVKVIHEGLAVVLAERPVVVEKDENDNKKDVPYSGLGISLGSGRANCVLSYRGLEILGLSVDRCGDWIDSNVSDATNIPISQVTRIKERDLNFDDLDYESDILFALDTFYSEMLRYIFNKFAGQFVKLKSQFEYPLPIVIAGGTSCPKGFITKAREVINNLELPFQIGEIKHANEPHQTVAKGLLTQALITQKRIKEGKDVKTA